MNRPDPSGGAAQATAARTIVIDSEHFAIRFLLPVLTIVTLLVVHLGGTALLDSLIDGVNPLCIVLPADAAVLFLGSNLIERALKRLLPSRRRAVLDAEALVVTDGRRTPPEVTRIAWDRAVNVRAWYFPVRRRGARVPRGWYCMAMQLLQDDADVILYTFMPPNDAEASAGYAHFVRLRPRQETRSNTDLSAAADQRRLLKLEDARWNDGAEIVREDFAAVLATLARVVPDWR